MVERYPAFLDDTRDNAWPRRARADRADPIAAALRDCVALRAHFRGCPKRILPPIHRIADYFIVLKTELNVAALYSASGGYAYRRGISWVAIVALIAALPSLPGFLATIEVIDGMSVPAALFGLYN